MSKVKMLLQQLQDGVKEVFSSGEYQEFLRFYSKMHKYSIRNVMLILTQMPEAQMVASYRTWKSLGINVKKGEKGLNVLVPIPYKKKDVEEEEEGIWFKVGSVFDVSQTDGCIPDLCKELTMNSKEVRELVNWLIAKWNVHFDFSLVGKDKKGYCSPFRGIVLQPEMSDSQTLKTLVHERAHQIMHIGTAIDRETAELEAESTAFVVCGSLGVETGDYSFGYVVGWAGAHSKSELEKSLTRIERCSKELLQEIGEWR